MVSSVVCNKPDLQLALIRGAVYVLGPFVLALALSALIHTMVSRCA